jgi:hypothetical protein
MKQYAGIEIPIKDPVKVPLSSNMDAVDFFLDLYNDNRNVSFETIYRDTLSTMNIVMCKFKNRLSRGYLPYNFIIYYYAYVVVICNPPAFFRSFTDQKYVIFTSRLLHGMYAYFQARKFEIKNINEWHYNESILTTINEHIIKLQKHGTI